MTRFAYTAGTLIDRIKINETQRVVSEERTLWIKRRRAGTGQLLACANGFFRLAGAPLRAIADTATWQRWEIDCFRRLHGDQLHASAPGPRSIAIEEIPGVNLTQYLDTGTITEAMSAAAGRELRRVHQCQCAELSGAWSHGDPHAGNFIYTADSDRAWIIDFEVMHCPGLEARERHVDDALVFLQDMVGRIRSELWVPCARAFLEGYDQPALLGAILEKLQEPPSGLCAYLWRAVRISYLRGAELRWRVQALRHEMGRGTR